MKVAYFDCFSGASGDMILGALLDAGLDLETLRRELAELHLTGYSLGHEKVEKSGLAGSRAVVEIHGGSHEHSHRHLDDITTIIERSGLDRWVKEQSVRVFTRLAEAEARVHRTSVDKVIFHEVGAMDAIIDVVGSVAGLAALGVEKIVCSPLHLGSGTVECAHGVLPVPAPATAELVKGRPAYSTGVRGELLTPTGAAILTTLAAEFGPMPPMAVERIGYGAGTLDLSMPNLLRIFIGDAPEAAGRYLSEQVAVVETNIDDMNPQIYDYLMEKTLSLGALDVFLVPVQMKKGRPGTLLTVICAPEQVGEFSDLLLRETTTIGLRWRIDSRIKASRSFSSVETKYGVVQLKVARAGDVVINVSPEYEDCKRLALEHGIPLKEVMEEARRMARTVH